MNEYIEKLKIEQYNYLREKKVIVLLMLIF